jgi:hypothetical protein
MSLFNTSDKIMSLFNTSDNIMSLFNTSDNIMSLFNTSDNIMSPEQGPYLKKFIVILYLSITAVSEKKITWGSTQNICRINLFSLFIVIHTTKF